MASSAPDGPAAPADGGTPAAGVELNYLNTVELLPGADNYLYDDNGTVGARPGQMTIALGGLPAKALADRAKLVGEVKAAREKAAEQKQFGTCDGVIVRCLLNIWGVIMFLRMGFVVSHAGIWQAVLVVFASLALTVLTATSLSAIATNGEVEGGGAYFLISRSLGAESGGAIGLIFAVANAVSVSMYLIGFAETVVGLYGPGEPSVTAEATVAGAVNASLGAAALSPSSAPSSPGASSVEVVDNYMTSREWDIRIIAFIGLFVIMCVACAGANWVVKIDIGQLVVLVIGILSFFFGSILTAPNFDPVEGIAFTGYNSTTFATNWHSDYRPTPVNPDGENFMSIFSVFFPAVTGMMAGANISGELRNAQKSLPFGTMFAVVLSNVVYMGIAVILGATCLRDGGAYGGLFGDSMLMIRIAAPVEFLVIVGIFASTLSSALATLVGAPRILKAVCDDGLFPPLQWFAAARQRDNEPIRGYFLTAVVAAAGIMIGDLNAIAPLITNFFLATRALINFACFLASYSRSPGWRPSYRMYNKWVSLVTAVLCIAVMFAISWWQALITMGVGAFLYVYIRRGAPAVNWGAAELGLKWLNAKKAMLHLDKVQLSHHVKTWRPIFLAVPLEFSRDTEPLVNYSRQLAHANGFTIVADILVGQFHELSRRLHDRVELRRKHQNKPHNGGSGSGSGSSGGSPRAGSGSTVGSDGVPVGVADSADGNGAGGDAGAKTDANGAPTKALSFGNVGSSRMTRHHSLANDIFSPEPKSESGTPEGSPVPAAASPAAAAASSEADANADGVAAAAAPVATGERESATGAGKDDAGDKDTKTRPGVRFGDGGEGKKDAAGENADPDDGEEENPLISIRRNNSMTLIEEGVTDLKDVLTETLIAPSVVDGVRTMIQMSGVGLMRPNMLLVPTVPALRPIDAPVASERTEEYTDDLVDILLSGLRFEFGVGLLSAPSSDWGAQYIRKGVAMSNLGSCFSSRRRYGDMPNLAPEAAVDGEAPTIDVYWVSDTGGCLLLIAYMHSQWAKWKVPCRLVSARSVCGLTIGLLVFGALCFTSCSLLSLRVDCLCGYLGFSSGFLCMRTPKTRSRQQQRS